MIRWAHLYSKWWNNEVHCAIPPLKGNDSSNSYHVPLLANSSSLPSHSSPLGNVQRYKMTFPWIASAKPLTLAKVTGLSWDFPPQKKTSRLPMEHAGPRDSSEGPKRRPILELGIPMKPQNSTSAPTWATVGTGPFGSHCEKKKIFVLCDKSGNQSPNGQNLDGISDIKYLLKPAKQSYLHPRHAVKSVTWGSAAISALQPTRPAGTGWSKNRPTNILDP